MLAVALAGGDEGQWLRAERQSAGRGRRGRIWQSPPGNLYASTLVRLRPNDPAAPSLALLAGVALAQVAAKFVVGAVLKWPNDLLIGGAKVAGILLERSGDAVVIGFGVNVEHHPDLVERPTTSMADHGAAVAPAKLVELLAAQMAGWLVTWRTSGLEPVRTAWTDLAHPVGTRLRADLPDGTSISGEFAGLDANGALLLSGSDRSTRVIHAGDVFAL